MTIPKTCGVVVPCSKTKLPPNMSARQAHDEPQIVEQAILRHQLHAVGTGERTKVVVLVESARVIDEVIEYASCGEKEPSKQRQYATEHSERCAARASLCSCTANIQHNKSLTKRIQYSATGEVFRRSKTRFSLLWRPF